MFEDRRNSGEPLYELFELYSARGVEEIFIIEHSIFGVYYVLHICVKQRNGKILEVILRSIMQS